MTWFEVTGNDGARASVGKWISSFKEFPTRQKPAIFSIEEVMRKLETNSSGK